MSHADDKSRKLTKIDAEWRAQLDPMQFEVARHAASERPFSGKKWDHWDHWDHQDHREKDHYNCVGCGTPLFQADSKFEAGCGWPSCSEPVNAEVIERIVDKTHGMVRVEVRCNNCSSHLHHVFDDGPTPTGG